MSKVTEELEDVQRLEENMTEIVSEDKRYDQRFFNRFTADERHEMNFSTPHLVKWVYEDIELANGEHEKGDPVEAEYSANANDYFMRGDDSVFKLSTLYCTASYEGIGRRIVLKMQPTVEDLRNWRTVAFELANVKP